ncbi:MAG: ABC transporter permease subunit, partial [Gaiellaceae bacterium]
MATRVDTLEPLPTPEPEGPPVRRLSAREWARANLFSSPFNTLLTIFFAAGLAWLLYRMANFVFVTGRWEIIDRNLTNILVFRFPRDELWRLWVALYILAASFGLGAGAAARARAVEVEEGMAEPVAAGLTLRRLGPLVLVVAVFLWFAGSVEAVALVAGVAATAVVFRLAGARLPRTNLRWTVLAVLLGILFAFAVVVGFGGVGWERWGGLLLTVFLAVGGIALSFPFGVLLALGRRSSLPAVRVVCVAYIELIRGVPLITILFMGAFMLGFFLPPGTSTPSLE